MALRIVVCLTLLIIAFGNLTNGKSTCKMVCPKIDPKKLNVHIICNSHLDLGWKSTTSNYYTNYVKYVIGSVLSALKANSNRKFVHAESAYLQRWFQQENLPAQEQFKQFVNDGQIEIVSGAWAINDEAVTHYQSIIDQFALGLKAVDTYLGKCGKPKIAWQMHTYGHSNTMANLISEMDYRFLMIDLIHYKDLQQRHESKNTEFYWKNNNYARRKYLLTSIVPTFNSPQDWESNTNHKEWFKFLSDQAHYYPTNNIMVKLGDEFDFYNASDTFSLVDYAIKFTKGRILNNGQRVNIFYSSPSCYSKAVYDTLQQQNITLKVKNGDFLPLALNANTNLVGFYSSRPTLKRMEREGNNLLQICKQLAVQANSDSVNPEFKIALAEMQSHETITGTQKQVVAFDTMKTLHQVMVDGVERSSESIRKLLEINPGDLNDLRVHSCFLRNISVCSHTIRSHFLVILYNPLTHPVDYYVRLPVKSNNYYVKGNNVEKVPVQFSPTLNLFQRFHNVLPYEMTFLAENIPPLGLKVYKIARSKNKHGTTVPNKETTPNEKDGTDSSILGLKNGYWFKLNEYGRILKIGYQNQSMSLSHNLVYYENRNYIANDAYVFNNPGVPSRLYNSKYGIFAFQVTRGPVYDEVYQDYAPWAKQFIRVYKNVNINYVEFEWVIGKIPRNPGRSIEIISRFTTDLQSNTSNNFFTDSNGRGEMARNRTAQYCDVYEDDINRSCITYPIVTNIRIQDEYTNQSFCVITDRAQGGTSLNSKQIDLMLHRKLIRSDDLGLGEALNEENAFHGAIARGSHYVTMKTDNVQVVNEKVLQPWIFIGGFNDYNKYKNGFKWEVSGLAGSFPPSIHLLTLEPFDDSYSLMRIENINTTGNPILINLNNAFVKFSILGIMEKTLAGLEPLVEMKNGKLFADVTADSDYLTYLSASANTESFEDNEEEKENLDELRILLGPLQIRTFLILLRYR